MRPAPPPRRRRPGRQAGRGVPPPRPGAALSPTEFRVLWGSPGTRPAPAALLGDPLGNLRALSGISAGAGEAEAVRTPLDLLAQRWKPELLAVAGGVRQRVRALELDGGPAAVDAQHEHPHVDA